MKSRLIDIGLYALALILLCSLVTPTHVIAGIVLAIVPNNVNVANKRGTSNVFQLAANTSAASAGTAFCDDGSGNVTTSGCTAGGAAGSNLFSSTSTGTVTAAADTTLIGTVTGSTTVPANTWTAGSVMEISAQGYYTTPAAARTLNLKLNIGGSTRITTGAFTVIPSVTLGVWKFHCLVTTQTTGAGGTQIANCQFVGSGTTLTAGDIVPLQTSSTWTINTTIGEAIDFTAAWDSTTGSPTISCSNIAAWIPGAPVTSVNGQTGAVNGSTTAAVASLPAAGNSGKIFFPSNSAYIFMDNGSSQLPFGPVFSLTLPPTAGWTNDNIGSCTVDYTFKYGYSTCPANGGTTNSARIQYRTAPATPYTILGLVRCDFAGSDGGYAACGLWFRDGTGKLMSFILQTAPIPIVASHGWELNLATWTNSTTFGSISSQWPGTAVLAPAVSTNTIGENLVLAISDDGTTNLTFKYSIDGGNHFKSFATAARTAFFASGPTQIGWGSNPINNGVDMALFSWAQTSP